MIDTQRQETERSSIWNMIAGGCGTAADRRNQRIFTQWCLAWAATLIGATWVLENIDVPAGLASWAIGLVPNVFALGALIAYMRFLRMADELQRRIQVEGLAVGFGTGWMFAIGYQVLERAGAPELTVTATILVMTGGWMIGQILAVRHYR